MWRVSVVTVTLNRPSLEAACRSVDDQTYRDWHHYVLGDGVVPTDYRHPQRTTLGFARALGAEEPGLNMPDGTPNPLLRWSLEHLALGELVCFLDDDNAYRPSFLERMVAALEHGGDTVGIALCQLADHRYGRLIEGYPDGRCDNSGFLARSSLARRIRFPAVAPEQEVAQDVEFIARCADLGGWVRVPETLVDFGVGDNQPPRRGNTKWLASWSVPLAAVRRAHEGDPAQAIPPLADALAEDPHDAWSRWRLGEALLLAGRRGACLRHWRAWLELFEREQPPRHHWLCYWAGLAKQAALNDPSGALHVEESLALLRETVARLPDADEAWLNIGLGLLALGSVAEGLDAYRTALELEPSRNRLLRAGWNLRVLGAALPGVGGTAEAERMVAAAAAAAR
jgi:tetratricopeptide (TPR) repeat protein